MPRPVHNKQELGAPEAFKKKLSEIATTQLEANSEKVKRYQNIRYWCQDESRIGLITLHDTKITGKGIQPTGEKQWKFDYLWLYGLVEPRTGDNFFREFSHLDGLCFEQYLSWFAQEYPDDLHLIQVDNSRCP